MVNFCKPPEKDGTYTSIPPLPLAYRHPPGLVALCIATCKLYLVVVAFAFIVNNKDMIMELFKFGKISKEEQEYLFFLGWHFETELVFSPCGRYSLSIKEGILRHIG